MYFEPIAEVNNHEQTIFALRYQTKAWEEGDDEDPFHEEVGYWLWDKDNQQVMKSFIVPRGISVNAGGAVSPDAQSFTLTAILGSETYGICSNQFLDREFKSIRYDVNIEKIDEDTFSYDEDTQIAMKGRKDIFHHREKNILKRV